MQILRKASYFQGNMAMKLKGVIFDMDGVIVNSEPVHFAAETEILNSLGIFMSKEELHKFVGLAMDKFWMRMKSAYPLKQSVEELLAYDTKIRTFYFSNYKNFETLPGVRRLMENIKSFSVPMALASSSHPNLIDIVLERLDYEKFFSYRISGFDIKRGKPDPDIFLSAAEKLGTAPGYTVVIEDSGNGVLAAKAAGMKCVGYINPRSGKQDLSSADICIDDFGDIDVHVLDRLFD